MDTPRFKSCKHADEKRVLTFDFTADLETGETLVGPATVSATIARGKDATPASIINGVAVLDATNKMVLQGVQGGTPGAEYKIKVIIATTNAKKVLVGEAILPVMA
jgi:hypothetical protein